MTPGLPLRTTTLILAALLLCGTAFGQAAADSLRTERGTTHQIGAGFRAEYIYPTNPFLRGENAVAKPLNTALSAHLNYAFGPRQGSLEDRIYKGVYQGIGVAYYNFGNKPELGNPTAVYLFQGARLARLGARLSLDYSWNFGLSFGWKAYDEHSNSFNQMMGSKLNAYLNANFYLNWMLTRKLDLRAGLSLTHFSNGNTSIPNTGLNTSGLNIGLSYNFSRREAQLPHRTLLPAFPRHISYDLTLFGSWRCRGFQFEDKQFAAPGTFTVLGLNLAAMYNFGYKFRAGISADGVYDSSANLLARYKDEITQLGEKSEIEYIKASFDEQIALGLSARAEFVMPYFTVGLGLGVNVLHKGGDLNAFYQMLTLKIAVTRSSYLHIGYCLKNFHQPNFLMLGVGFRFNNKYPVLR